METPARQMDLERRLWSGRLAELLGEPGPYDVEVASLDWFVRTLGFRHDAEAAWKALDGGTRATCEAYARGVNAWIDSGDWSRDAAWSALESRPRLWAPSDCLLLRDAPVCVDGSGDVPFSAPGHAAWTADWNRRCSALWAALHGTPLRAPGGAAAGRRFRWVFCAEGGQEQLLESTAGTPSSSAAQPPSAREAPRLVPVELLDEGPHRFARPDGRWGKLRAKRTDLAVRGEPSPRRAWVRRAPSGGLVSDVFAGASATDAPTGTGFAWSWGEVRPSAGP